MLEQVLACLTSLVLHAAAMFSLRIRANDANCSCDPKLASNCLHQFLPAALCSSILTCHGSRLRPTGAVCPGQPAAACTRGSEDC